MSSLASNPDDMPSGVDRTSTRPATMAAATFDRYGPPETVEVRRVSVPTIAAAEVLVRVGAAGLNPYDWHHYRGEPMLFVRPTIGVRRPRTPLTLGADVAGVVVQVGADVTGFARGDRVYGEVGHGTCAEWVVAAADRLTRMPEGLSFEQAAAIPMGALTALQGLRDGELEPGHRVLVNGASGGVGHMAVQLAKAMGAGEVTGVCSTRNLDLVRGLGADQLIDYTTDDLTRQRGHDLLLDTVGNHSTRTFARMLAPTGCLVLVGGGRGRWVEPGGQVLRGLAQSPLVRPRVAAIMTVDGSGDALSTITDLVESGVVTPVVERSYPLADIVEALHQLEAGHVRGKLVVVP